MRMGKKISVYLSCYNEERFIGECLSSILAQTFQPDEIIVVNDASTDSSMEIVEEYAKKDSRINVISNPENIGLTRSLNVAIQHASGDYLAEIDADDVLLPRFLELLVGFLEDHKDYYLAGCGELQMYEDGSIFNISKVICDEIALKKELEKRYAFSSGIVYRNDGSSFYREKFYFAEDRDFALMALTLGKRLINIPQYLYKWRLKPGGESVSSSGKIKLFSMKAQEFYFQRLRYGYDKYDEFDPNEILSINVDETDNKTIILEEIKWSFKTNKLNRARKFAIRYFSLHGYHYVPLKYFFLCSLGKGVIMRLKHLKRKLNTRRLSYVISS
jgi:glycosyltransferase involved in cell wall biosynthesis